MRKFLFRLLIVLIVLMVALISYSSYNHMTPRTVLVNMFSSSSTTTTTQTPVVQNTGMIASGTDTTGASGLSTKDMSDTKDLVNSLNVQ